MEREKAVDVQAQAREVSDLFQLLSKAQKALRLYRASNTIYEQHLTTLCARWIDCLKRFGDMTLSIEESRILLEDQVVYQGDERVERIAFLIFRDGIRSLTFKDTLTASELARFVVCINRVALATGEGEDLVTLFWEEEFQSITYFAVEELGSTAQEEALIQRLDVAATAPMGLMGGAGAAGQAAPASGLHAVDSVNLEDVERPTSHLPVDACRLSEQETQQLQLELALEEADPHWCKVVELAVDLILLESEPSEQLKLTSGLSAVVGQWLERGLYEEVVRALEHVDRLAEVVLRENPPLLEIRASLLSHLASPPQLSAMLERVDADRSLEPEVLASYLARLGEGVVPTLIGWLGRLSTPGYRAALADALYAHQEKALALISRRLPPARADVEATFLVEALGFIGRCSLEQAQPLLEGLLGSTERRVRLETARAISRFRDRRMDNLCLQLLEDKSEEVRTVALDTLVRLQRKRLARNIFEATQRPPFAEHSAVEKRRYFVAVAKLAGDPALDWLLGVVQAQEGQWFGSAKSRDYIEAAIHGIRAVGGAEAERLLREMAEGGGRVVKAAARRALGGEKRGRDD